MTSSTDFPIDEKTGLRAYPSSAQLRREAEIRSEVVTNLSRAFSARMKAVELAAQFKSDDPMKLAREIYKFISDTEV